MTNKSATYLLPLISKIVPIINMHEYIKETYLYNYNNFERFNLHLKVLKLPEGIFNELTSHKSFIGLLNTDEHQLLTFKLHERFHHDYECLENGNYSKFKEESKDYVLKYWSSLAKKNIVPIDFIVRIRDIFNKSEILKKELENKIGVELPVDAELSSIIDTGDEIYGG